jgi:hypothetical protein
MVLTNWNLFVKKIYHEGRKKNKTFKFKDALKEASSRKSEMTTASMTPSNSSNRSKRARRSRKKSKANKKPFFF